MTRMGRNFIGAPGAHPSVSNTCMIVTTIWIIFWLIDAVLQIVLDVEGCWGGTVRTNEDGTTEIECLDGTFKEISSTYNTISIIAGVLGFIFFCYMLVAVCQTRYATRQKFNIPPGCCGGCEDFCCVLWCSCCAVSVREIMSWCSLLFCVSHNTTPNKTLTACFVIGGANGAPHK